MSSRKIFDAHVHAARGSRGYDLEVCGRNRIFNTVESYRKRRPSPPSDSVSLVFDYRDNLDYVLGEVRSGAARALKIHSRLQRIKESDYPALIESLDKAPAAAPVIVDAFYYGSDLDVQPSLRGIIELLKAFPKRHFIIAHCGGYRIPEYFYHLREFENFSYELSFALQYFTDSSLEADLKKLIKHTDRRRILFGSDFPFASPRLQFERLESLFAQLGLPASELDWVCRANAVRRFLKRTR
jgi:predicted TIM-barrel fold metal-dependent hydrolase